ncbi:MAG: dephospho-CoA kinase [Acidobacteriaceae bacterium]|nr:dephospho-CoA kinase [Acidobacteriaceae bacterium]
MFAALGAQVLSSDDMARAMMQPGQSVYAAIVERFGSAVVLADGTLDRLALSRIAFAEGRVEELNAIVHPAVIARQEEMVTAIASQDPHAVVMIESALVFETKHAGDEPWRRRFDKIVLVTAPEELKIARFVARASKGSTLSESEREALEAEARRRLGLQMSDDKKASLSDYVLTNDGPETELEWQVDQLWAILKAAAGA